MVSRHMTMAGLMVLACTSGTLGADLTSSFLACARDAAGKRELIWPMDAAGKKASTNQIALLCDGTSAAALFKSMELVSTQELGGDGVIYRRSAKGVQCSRIPSPTVWHSCFITIEVDNAFADGMD